MEGDPGRPVRPPGRGRPGRGAGRGAGPGRWLHAGLTAASGGGVGAPRAGEGGGPRFSSASSSPSDGLASEPRGRSLPSAQVGARKAGGGGQPPAGPGAPPAAASRSASRPRRGGREPPGPPAGEPPCPGRGTKAWSALPAVTR